MKHMHDIVGKVSQEAACLREHGISQVLASWYVSLHSVYAQPSGTPDIEGLHVQKLECGKDVMALADLLSSSHQGKDVHLHDRRIGEPVCSSKGCFSLRSMPMRPAQAEASTENEAAGLFSRQRCSAAHMIVCTVGPNTQLSHGKLKLPEKGVLVFGGSCTGAHLENMKICGVCAS